MSVNEFVEGAREALVEEQIRVSKLINKLAEELPDRDIDPETQLLWPKSEGWSQIVRKELENAGYEVTFLPRIHKYLIEFSDTTKREMKKENKLQEDIATKSQKRFQKYTARHYKKPKNDSSE